MFAAGPVARFATAPAWHGGSFDLQPRVRTGWELADNIRVTIRARLVADVVRAGNFERGHDRGGMRGARNQTNCQANSGVNKLKR